MMDKMHMQQNRKGEMAALLQWLGPLNFAASKTQDDDSFVDRMHHTYTTIVLIVFAVIVSTKQYVVSDPITCWTPGHFPRHYIDYANRICWVSNTYYVPQSSEIPQEGAPREHINYYQWVPMILLTQAALFYLPCLVWRSISGKVGVEINSLVHAGRNMIDVATKHKNLTYMVRQMDRYLSHYRDDIHGFCFKLTRCFPRGLNCGKKYGNFLICFYLIIKCMYLANALGQLFLMDVFLDMDFHFYGIQVLRHVMTGSEWPGTSRFPRVTMCDFHVRQLGNTHRHTVQCVLPINYFNEKLFIVLWFWLLIIAVVTTIDFIVWMSRAVLVTDRLRFVRRFLRNMGRLQRAEDRAASRKFAQDYLRQDGVLILRLVALNTSDLVASDLATELFEFYRGNPPTLSKKRQDEGKLELSGLAAV